MGIEAVIWDFGGVFTTSPFDRFAIFETERGLPKDFIRTINATNPDANAWARFERSEISLDEFDEAFLAEAAAAGHEVRGKEIVALLSGTVRPEMVRALDRILAHGIRCACITNNVRAGQGPGISADAETAAAVADVMSRFELIVESSKVGVRKPDPKIYRHALGELGVAAEAAVYLDDLGVNLKPARQLGMQTIKVLGPEQALGELEAIVGIDLRA
ncbi:HAD-IA family hydrolase [Minwuia thermotolerans]|uniref:HAD family hydrolase n=1 Tax=Minwuia thermotolerans TaxID=2056226 RepID=A0A2M9G6A6_9PROT|nr:HAD-IA family hydrolase [Minwuia thermotolerans]PJK31255.1 HAD family hydrolase [Minwuia thermotolerans]